MKGLGGSGVPGERPAGGIERDVAPPTLPRLQANRPVAHFNLFPNQSKHGDKRNGGIKIVCVLVVPQLAPPISWGGKCRVWLALLTRAESRSHPQSALRGCGAAARPRESRRFSARSTRRRKHRAQSFGALNAFEKSDRQSGGMPGRMVRKSWRQAGPKLSWTASLPDRVTRACRGSLWWEGGASPGGSNPRSSPAAPTPASAEEGTPTAGLGLASLRLRASEGAIAEESDVATPDSREAGISPNSSSTDWRGD